MLAACESRRDCSVKRRDEILSEKNEQKVSAMEVDCSPEMSRVGRAGMDE